MENAQDLTISSDAILGAIMALVSLLPPDNRIELCARLVRLNQETEDVVISDEDTWSRVSDLRAREIRITTVVGLAILLWIRSWKMHI